MANNIYNARLLTNFATQSLNGIQANLQKSDISRALCVGNRFVPIKVNGMTYAAVHETLPLALIVINDPTVDVLILSHLLSNETVFYPREINPPKRPCACKSVKLA